MPPAESVSPSESFAVHPDELMRHASGVDQLGDRAELAAAALRYVRLDAGAYGQLCAFVPTLLAPVQERIDVAARESADALRGVATRLRRAASAYESTDAAASNGISDAGRRVQ